MAIHPSDFRCFRARFHRNGIGGDSFYLCRFLYGRGKDTFDMQAVVFPSPGRVAVTSDQIDEKWRGDDFEPALRKAIERFEAEHPDECFGG